MAMAPAVSQLVPLLVSVVNEWMEQRNMGKGGGEQQGTSCEACGDLLGQGSIPNMVFTNVERFDLLEADADGKGRCWTECCFG
jgi:hypothetical protein